METKFKLEIANDCVALDLLEGDEIIYTPVIKPRANGEDLAVMDINGEIVVAPYTKFGTQYIIMGDRFSVFKDHQVRILGKVIGGSHEQNKKPAAAYYRSRQGMQLTSSFSSCG